MNDREFLADRFEAHRGHLKAVAYRMLGSLTEAEDAVQEAWLRLSRSEPDDVRNLGGWLTTVVGRVCLDMLRARTSRREEPLEARMPDPVVSPATGPDPEQAALLADSVGLALLVVLESLAPAERLAFVLHDMFAVPFEEIAPLVGRSPATARQLASRARRRVRGAAPVPDPDLARQREIVEAFLAAAHRGDFAGLVSVLDPEVVLRADAGALSGGLREVRGADNVAGQALAFRRHAPSTAHAALVNGLAGVVNTVNGEPSAVMSFTIAGGRIVEIDILADPARLARLDLAVLGD
ncbi:putative RNA polymerase sigma factor [[Actinomadura] parvosata subsp. kistnae]|uniref:RNA polymerase subunit sigma-70 n=1 Tax=[Actinomadura] parvosata subsp. kistnae TaxID=1909395 RepID=A0A1U9ZVC3_9ACTN|nr:RNA polymerase sigma factor SigJ [Nonomuraea sp. ATCC 55076]AQZ61888.1 RNA polymerase subunit sigma-70 [Nonomuraea sp. ATCC 55076]SPL88042.1 putative RNA polymerase sigma factor [Actinomadura parvosata subsp. kistnae]